MNILNDINTAGLNISLVGDRLKVANPEKLNDSLRNLIRTNKAEIIKQLSVAQIQQNIREQIEERAAIQEFDGGLQRADADVAAAKSMRVYCYRVTDKPNSELTVIMPNTELIEAEAKLREKYGDRLLSVEPMATMAESPTKH